MILSYLILGLMVSYSGWTLYRSFRNLKAGKSCDNCTGCSLKGACPVQQLKANQAALILDQNS
ncbi:MULTISPECIES: FeoB-associated Cys-rich membrane protein [Tepidibacillus]|uniref:Attachment p12 family protein n=1 Tax=Tepidibacillus fermentans TaxID=1281767 RepID=A0A4R3KGU8_9BACI|nr:FeoB-associated Cys-rich membrane protein [Tepidibacillus fermentans]TCS82470.1 attachment p12 family protein [Tepidibacillus fermentans]